jgi:hypothetical protein
MTSPVVEAGSPVLPRPTSPFLSSSSAVAAPDSLLESRYPGTSPLPKTHVLHQKTMEIYSELGAATP